MHSTRELLDSSKTCGHLDVCRLIGEVPTLARGNSWREQPVPPVNAGWLANLRERRDFEALVAMGAVGCLRFDFGGKTKCLAWEKTGWRNW